jgi:hypothetical protein
MTVDAPEVSGRDVLPAHPMRESALKRLSAGVQRHWFFLTILLIGLVLRIFAVVAYRPALLFIDSFRYLDLIRTTDPGKAQTLGYVFFLWPLLHVTNLFGIALAQHLVGVGMSVGIYLLCLRYGVVRWLATIAAVPVLLDAYQIQIEHTIMSETLFEALLLAGLMVLLWRRKPTTRALVIGGLLLGATVPVRIVSLPVLLPAVIFACCSGDGGWRRLGRGAMLAAAFLVPVVGYATYYRTQTGVWGLSTSDARALYGRAAEIADCSTLELPAYERPLCPKEPLGRRIGIDYYAHTYPVAQLVHVPPGKTLNDVVRDFARRVFRQQPLDLLHGVTVDFLKTFRWDRVDAKGDVPVSRWQFQERYPTWPDSLSTPEAAAKRWGGGAPTVVRPIATFLANYQRSVGYLPGPPLALGLIVGIAAGCGAGRARRARLRAVCWLPTLTALAVILPADLFEFSWRYQLPLLVLVPVAGAIGVTAMLRDPATDYPARAHGDANADVVREGAPVGIG